MEHIVEFHRINELFAVYGKSLTHRQQLIMESYYVFNLGVQEIADELNISKAAVSDALKVSIKHLETLEKNIKHIAYKHKVKALHTKIKKNTTDENIVKLLQEGEDDGI